MAIGVTLTPTKQIARDEVVSSAKLNLLARLTAAISGTVDTSQITNDAVTWTKAYPGEWFYAASTSGSTANAHTVTTGSSLASLPTGFVIVYRVPLDNTGAVTLSVDGLSTLNILLPGGTALAAGDLVAGQVIEIRKIGTTAYLMTPTANSTQYSNTGEKIFLSQNYR